MEWLPRLLGGLVVAFFDARLRQVAPEASEHVPMVLDDELRVH